MLKDKITEITKDTKGVIVFQEQFIKILISIGYSPDEANEARKSIGKKHHDKMAEFKEKLLLIFGSEEEESIDYLIKSVNSSYCETYLKTFEKGAVAFLDSIVNEDGTISHVYQLNMILHLLFTNLTADEDIDVIISFVKGKYGHMSPAISNKVVKILTSSTINREENTQLLFLEN